ncbi:MAG: hypothetical protein LBC60_00075 [Spirochaetaceae bacterium]|nr:hypothetical protein [Spirochaetaceae bacterium]
MPRRILHRYPENTVECVECPGLAWGRLPGERLAGGPVSALAPEPWGKGL